MAQRPQGRRDFPPVEILGSINAGLDVYSDPTTTVYKKWLSAANCFSGAFGFVQRARFANVLTQGVVSSATISTIQNVLTTTIRVTTTAPHGFAVGQWATLSGTTCTTIGFSPTLFNGTFFINATTATTFDCISASGVTRGLIWVGMSSGQNLSVQHSCLKAKDCLEQLRHSNAQPYRDKPEQDAR